MPSDNHNRHRHGGGTAEETFPLTAASTKVLQRTYEATTLNAGSRRRRQQRQGSFRSTEESVATVDEEEHPRTTDFETVVHLLKGYLGAGCLSLPYAISQLGVIGGVLSIFALSYWTSSNCYTVVNIRRHMERTSPPDPPTTVSNHHANYTSNQPSSDNNNNNNNPDDVVSETSSSNITYPDVGNWAYGTLFQVFVSSCIITLQMAVCTVYVSFIGENLLAVARFCGLPWVTHTLVMTVALPFILALSFLPSLKVLAPVMATGTILLLITLASLGIIVWDEWPNRPDTTPTAVVSQIPLALCMILYSYEGINIVLPVHAAMRHPSHFDFVFWLSMALVALCLAGVAAISVICFGDVTNGSLTAFLIEAYRNDHGADHITEWIMFANTTVSLSVLLTYPLTMYPAIELLGPILQRNPLLSRFFGGHADEDQDEDDLAAFEPLPPLPEHDAVSQSELEEQHSYGADTDPLGTGENARQQQDEDALSGTSSFVGAGQTFLNIHFLLPGDSAQLRATLVLTTYLIAVSIPNVQALISLVGALAGSSAALLIPPVLELAWVEHNEHIDEATKSPFPGSTSPLPPSPHLLRKQKLRQKKKKKWWDGGRYWKTKVKCYTSFVLGVVFLCIGTGFSVMDIINIYRNKLA